MSKDNPFSLFPDGLGGGSFSPAGGEKCFSCGRKNRKYAKTCVHCGIKLARDKVTDETVNFSEEEQTSEAHVQMPEEPQPDSQPAEAPEPQPDMQSAEAEAPEPETDSRPVEVPTPGPQQVTPAASDNLLAKPAGEISEDSVEEALADTGTETDFSQDTPKLQFSEPEPEEEPAFHREVPADPDPQPEAELNFKPEIPSEPEPEAERYAEPEEELVFHREVPAEPEPEEEIPVKREVFDPESYRSADTDHFFAKMEKTEDEDLFFADDEKDSRKKVPLWLRLPGLRADVAWKRFISGVFYVCIVFLLLLAALKGDYVTGLLIIGWAFLFVGGIGFFSSIIRKNTFRPFALSLVAAFALLFLGDMLQPDRVDFNAADPSVHEQQEEEPGEQRESGSHQQDEEPGDREESDHTGYPDDELLAGHDVTDVQHWPEHPALGGYVPPADREDEPSAGHEEEHPAQREDELPGEPEDELPLTDEPEEEPPLSGEPEDELPREPEDELREQRGRGLPSFYYADRITVFREMLNSQYDEWSYRVEDSTVYISLFLPAEYVDNLDEYASDGDKITDVAKKEAHKVAGEFYGESGPRYVVPEITLVDITVFYPSGDEPEWDSSVNIAVSN